MRALRSALDETNQKVATLSVPPPAPVPAPKPAASTAGREVTAEKLYAAAMASFRADEHGQAVLEFTDLIDKFPKHTLASSAQYWIGEAYYRQRDFNQAVTEFQKVPDLYPQSAQVAGVAAQARHVLPRPARPAARPRDVGAGGEVAPADRGRDPGARAPRLSRRRPLRRGDRARPVLPQFDAPVY